MREQLIQYVNLLFAGAPDCDDIRQEILHNTLDRYDDLISQGKSPEAAYRLAISGIGDINEILGAAPRQSIQKHVPQSVEDDPQRKKIRSLAIALYILSAIPLFIFSELGLETLGLCLTVVIAAIATYLMLVTSRKEPNEESKPENEQPLTPRQEVKKSVDALIGAIILAVYLIVSFATKAWFITWLIFPIGGSIKGLVKAIMDLKEANNHEN